MPCAQQHHAHKGAPHSQRIRNFVVAHIRVIAHHQRHARPAAQFVQRLAHFFAGTLLNQLIQLAGVRMLQRHIFHIARFLVLADFPPPQHIPAVVRRHLVKPGGERPRCVVLHQLVLQFHENFHRGVFGIFARRQGTPAEPEDCRRVLPVKLPPGLGVTRPGTGNRLRRFLYSRRVHPAWSRRFHRLVRAGACKYYTLQIRPRQHPHS